MVLLVLIVLTPPHWSHWNVVSIVRPLIALLSSPHNMATIASVIKGLMSQHSAANSGAIKATVISHSDFTITKQAIQP